MYCAIVQPHSNIFFGINGGGGLGEWGVLWIGVAVCSDVGCKFSKIQITWPGSATLD